MNLYLLVWSNSDDTAELDWTHIVSEKEHLTKAEVYDAIVDYKVQEWGYTKAECKAEIGQYWSEKVGMVDGYKILTIKELK